MAAQQVPAIHVQGLVKSYKTLQVLRGVDFDGWQHTPSAWGLAALDRAGRLDAPGRPPGTFEIALRRLSR
jgi:hypothetical protein